MKLLIKNVRAVDAGLDELTDILIVDGIITRMGTDVVELCDGKEDRVIDATGLTAMPGLFDMHVHFRDPGQTYKEDILTGCQAALAGGVTGVLTMPNTKPPIDTPELVRYEIEKAKPTGVALYPVACTTKGMDGGELTDFAALKAAGAACLSDDGRPVKNAELMRLALLEAKKQGMLVASHCEDLDIINGGIMHRGSVSEALGVKGMDRASEDYITAREIVLASSVGGRVHICHVSTKESVELIRKAKAEGLDVTCETGPHYLVMNDSMLQEDGRFKMNPPIRSEEDRRALLAGLLDGTVDMIATDHAPHSAEEKSRGLEKSLFGVVGLETAFPVLYTELVKTGVLTLDRLIDAMVTRPARRFGIGTPALKEGAPADLTVFDLNESYKIDPADFLSMGRATPFAGRTVFGKCLLTLCGGEIAWQAEGGEKP